MDEISGFPVGVSAHLKSYVYRLIDPRNGETFYIGKGKDDRVFAHVRAQVDGDESSNKLRRIREIRLAGFEVAHVIHRHGMSEETAFEVEAALIDAYPGAENIVSGAGSGDYGAMHANEIVKRYAANVATFQHKAILINVSRTATERSIYDSTRYAWRINTSIASEAEVILSNRLGLIVGVFVATAWLEATPENFPGMEPMPGRKGFVGNEAPPELKALYIGKRVPDAFRKRGAAGPVKYTWSKAYQVENTDV